MSKQSTFLFFIILTFTISLPLVEGFGVGPPSFEFDLPREGNCSAKFFIQGGSSESQLIIGKENLPFKIEPSIMNLSSGDSVIELTFYGNETLSPGLYEGKVTFISMTGDFVALGVKIRAKINLLGEAPEIREEESEPEYVEFLTEPDEESPVGESKIDYGPYILGGIAGATVLGVLVVVVLRWKK